MLERAADAEKKTRPCHPVSLAVLSLHWAHLTLKTTVGSRGGEASLGDPRLSAARPWGMVESLPRKRATNDFLMSETRVAWGRVNFQNQEEKAQVHLRVSQPALASVVQQQELLLQSTHSRTVPAVHR